MNETIKLIEKIKQILIDYETTQELSKLVNIYEKLALNLVFLWEEASKLKLDYNMKFYNRKINLSHSYLSNKAEKITDWQSLKMAEVTTAEDLKAELEAEAFVVRVENFRSQCNKVLEAMRSRISWEKSEKERTKLDI